MQLVQIVMYQGRGCGDWDSCEIPARPDHRIGGSPSTLATWLLPPAIATFPTHLAIQVFSHNHPTLLTTFLETALSITITLSYLSLWRKVKVFDDSPEKSKIG